MTSSPHIITIIIVTYNSQTHIKNCLENLKSSLREINAEVIIVDNNSTDKTLSFIKDDSDSAIVIENKENSGFAKACNIGADKATGEFLLFLNPDVQLKKDAIANLLECMNKFGKVGAVSARMENEDGSFQPTCRNFPTMENIVFSRRSVFSSFFKPGSTYTLGDYSETTEVPAVAGTALMIRKETFDEIGQFDNLFFLYMEDTDLSFRLNKSGYKNYFCPSAKGIHLWGEGSSSGNIMRIWHHHISMSNYFMKHSESILEKFLIPFLLFSNLLLSFLLLTFKSKRKTSS